MAVHVIQFLSYAFQVIVELHLYLQCATKLNTCLHRTNPYYHWVSSMCCSVHNYFCASKFMSCCTINTYPASGVAAAVTDVLSLSLSVSLSFSVPLFPYYHYYFVTSSDKINNS